MTKRGQIVDRKSIEDAWFTFVDDNTPGGVTVIFAEEVTGSQAPRPQKPFITIKLLSGPTTKSMDDLRFKNDPGPPEENNTIYTLAGLRQYTVSLQAFGIGSQDNLSLVQTLLEDPDERQKLKTADISIVNRGQVLDISEIVDVGFERRHVLDIIFNSSSNVDVAPGSIEKATISGKLKKADGTEIIIDEVQVPNT